ncbi:SINGLE-STRANDED DNA-BINDING PROTEIN WHY1 CHLOROPLASTIC [Salix koriyanagi]|uniref:SINGLE-STRANDED DNA-BINDING PROTEIN WHY1 CHLOROPLASTIC n=1 Tax=Salix koriyanagi TaxID=2511006 RepID=A0A9Q1AF97_9ROSI|nr:SINGLE-STRANDED DNA-BINDING PROTEIN WHY1 CHLOROPLASTIC [Salix koriyanagi]
MGLWPMDGSINQSISILYPSSSSPSSLSVPGSTKKREERGKMLQLNNVSRVSSTPQNPKLWLLQSNSLCSQKSITFNSKTSSTEKKKTLGVKYQYYDQQHKNFTTSSRSSPSFAPPAGESAPKLFVGHSIYKGKAALTVEPRSPEFSPLDSGAYKLVKEGFVLLQFAPAAAVRQYDWTRKQVFSLSVTEIGHLVSLGPKDSCEFFHDPNKGKSEEGKVRKLLKVEPLPDGSGHFFNLSVQNKVLNIDESIYIPVTKAEYTVLTSAFNYILPYLLGWHAYANSIKPDDSSRGNNASPRYGGDHEWNR